MERERERERERESLFLLHDCMPYSDSKQYDVVSYFFHVWCVHLTVSTVIFLFWDLDIVKLVKLRSTNPVTAILKSTTHLCDHSISWGIYLFVWILMQLSSSRSGQEVKSSCHPKQNYFTRIKTKRKELKIMNTMGQVLWIQQNWWGKILLPFELWAPCLFILVFKLDDITWIIVYSFYRCCSPSVLC